MLVENPKPRGSIIDKMATQEAPRAQILVIEKSVPAKLLELASSSDPKQIRDTTFNRIHFAVGESVVLAEFTRAEIGEVDLADITTKLGARKNSHPRKYVRTVQFPDNKGGKVVLYKPKDEANFAISTSISPTGCLVEAHPSTSLIETNKPQLQSLIKKALQDLAEKKIQIAVKDSGKRVELGPAELSQEFLSQLQENVANRITDTLDGEEILILSALALRNLDSIPIEVKDTLDAYIRYALLDEQKFPGTKMYKTRDSIWRVYAPFADYLRIFLTYRESPSVE